MPPRPSQISSGTLPPGKSRLRAAADGFSLVEVALAIAILGTVILGMLALLSNGASAQAEAQKDTTAMMLAGQVVEALRGFEVGRDDTRPSKGHALLDEFLPFSFQSFPAGGEAFVLGFDPEGNKRGSKLSRDYEEGTIQDGVAYLARFEGRPVAGQPGLTQVVVRIEFPADLPRDRRRTKEFQVLVRPRAAENVPVAEGGQG